ncbi:hypothetical protein SEA_HANEM_105 [Gordonia phage Hanem]|nr:hypothetical protein SEA_HANEM_105 [Gordonia phage Hanem]
MSARSPGSENIPMTPASMLTNYQEEMFADPTIEVQLYYRADDQRFVVEIDSKETQRSVQGEGRKVKTAMAKALGMWNGDDDDEPPAAHLGPEHPTALHGDVPVKSLHDRVHAAAKRAQRGHDQAHDSESA